MNNMKYSILGVKNVHNKTNQDKNKAIPSKTYFGDYWLFLFISPLAPLMCE